MLRLRSARKKFKKHFNPKMINEKRSLHIKIFGAQWHTLTLWIGVTASTTKFIFLLSDLIYDILNYIIISYTKIIIKINLGINGQLVSIIIIFYFKECSK